MTRLAPALAVALVSASLGVRPAGACDSASCVLVTRGQDGVAKGAFSVDLSFRYSDESYVNDAQLATRSAILTGITRGF